MCLTIIEKYVLEFCSPSQLSPLSLSLSQEKGASEKIMQSHYALLKALGEVKKEKKEDFREDLREQFCHPYSPAVLRSWFYAEGAPGWGEPRGSIPKHKILEAVLIFGPWFSGADSGTSQQERLGQSLDLTQTCLWGKGRHLARSWVGTREWRRHKYLSAWNQAEVLNWGSGRASQTAAVKAKSALSSDRWESWGSPWPQPGSPSVAIVNLGCILKTPGELLKPTKLKPHSSPIKSETLEVQDQEPFKGYFLKFQNLNRGLAYCWVRVSR